MTSFENVSSTQKIRAALHWDVRTIGTETCHFLGLEISKPALEIVAELVYKKMIVYGADLEAFAKHAKRATINSDDVKLLVRRCPSLKSHLNIVAPSPKEKRRKTVAGKAPETPAGKQKEPEIPTSKQKEAEIANSKQRELEIPTSKQKEDLELKENDKQGERADIDMDIDDMIDLTFD